MPTIPQPAEKSVFREFASYGVLGIIALAALFGTRQVYMDMKASANEAQTAYMEIISRQSQRIEDLARTSQTVVENNTKALVIVGERVNAVETRLSGMETVIRTWSLKRNESSSLDRDGGLSRDAAGLRTETARSPAGSVHALEAR